MLNPKIQNRFQFKGLLLISIVFSAKSLLEGTSGQAVCAVGIPINLPGVIYKLQPQLCL
jgi:hypothetical protein